MPFYVTCQSSSGKSSAEGGMACLSKKALIIYEMATTYFVPGVPGFGLCVSRKTDRMPRSFRLKRAQCFSARASALVAKGGIPRLSPFLRCRAASLRSSLRQRGNNRKVGVCPGFEECFLDSGPRQTMCRVSLRHALRLSPFPLTLFQVFSRDYFSDPPRFKTRRA
jgi:hypothetical protein